MRLRHSVSQRRSCRPAVACSCSPRRSCFYPVKEAGHFRRVVQRGTGPSVRVGIDGAANNDLGGRCSSLC